MGEMPTYVFFSPKGVVPEYVFDEANLIRVESENGMATKRNGNYLIGSLKPGTNCLTKLFLKNGKQVNILTLTDEQSLDAWKGTINGVQHLFISKHNLMFTGKGLEIESVGNPTLLLSVYPALKKVYDKRFAQADNGNFTMLTTRLKMLSVVPKISEVTNISRYQNKGALLPEDDRNEKNTPASPGPQYQTNLKHVDGAKYWEISVKTSSSTSILDVDYSGDTGALYEDGKLINDDFYYGTSMQTIIAPTAGKITERRFLLQVVPLTSERKLYLEPEIEKKTQIGDASIKSIKVILTYRTVIAW